MKLCSLTAFAAAAMAAFTVQASNWQGINEASYLGGMKIAEADLKGKVVMVDCWGRNCPPCRALLPRLQSTWESFRHKPFVLLGSHCQGRDDEAIAAIIKENKITYPVYQFAGMAEGAPQIDGIPYIYVVDAWGKLIYNGHSLQEATEMAVNAMMDMPDGPPHLLPPSMALKHYKSMKALLRLGQPVARVREKLKADVSAAAKQPKNRQIGRAS